MIRIKARLDSFGELRKTNSERFSRISEQIGELRGMIMDSNKSIISIEAKATKASDLVSTVQPEKLMIVIRKVEGKTEALNASIESNDAIMKNIMEEIKSMRKEMKFYKGIEQVIKLNDDVKKELMEIKKTEAITKRHADKIETVFIEVNKKFTDFDKFNDVVKDLNHSFNNMQGDFDKMKVNIENKEDKKEFVNLLNKFNDFEKHTTKIIDLLDRKSRTLKSDINDRFEILTKTAEDKLKIDLKIKNEHEHEENVARQQEPQTKEKVNDDKSETDTDTKKTENIQDKKPALVNN